MCFSEISNSGTCHPKLELMPRGHRSRYRWSALFINSTFAESSTWWTPPPQKPTRMTCRIPQRSDTYYGRIPSRIRRLSSCRPGPISSKPNLIKRRRPRDNRVTMPPKRPVVKDTLGWKLALLEHRRILLERVIAEFPAVLQTNKSKVEFWRNRLTLH